MSELNHSVTKEFDRWLATELVQAHLESLGYKRACNGSYDVTFFDCNGNKISINKIVCVVEDANNPAKTEVKVSEKEAAEIIAASKGLDLKKHKVKISNY